MGNWGIRGEVRGIAFTGDIVIVVNAPESCEMIHEPASKWY